MPYWERTRIITNFRNIKSTQQELILEHLVRYGSITPLEALRLYGCFRLGARIWELKQDGYIIETEMIVIQGNKTIAKYKLIKSDQNGQISFL
jgi:hypothetical protein